MQADLNAATLPTMRILVGLLSLLILAAPVFAAAQTPSEPDPIPKLLAPLKSPDLQTRQAGFYSLLDSAPLPNKQIPAGEAIDNQISSLLSNYSTDRIKIVSALNQLLILELSDPILGTSDTGEDDGDFFLDLVTAVSDLNDPSTIPSLVGTIGSGSIVTSRLVSFGQSALDPVLATLYDSNFQQRDGAAFTLITMLKSPYSTAFQDLTSKSKIRAGLVLAINSFAGDYSYAQTPYQAALAELPAIVAGDLNADGLVNCADLAIIKASFGKRVGQPDFDIRADLNGDGKVDKKDLDTEAKLLPSMSCK